MITLGPIQIVFFSKIVHETCFKCSFLIKDNLLVVHLEVDFGVNKMTCKIFLHLVFVYSWWQAKFHWPRSKLKTKRNPPAKLLKNPRKLANCADFRKYKLFQPYSCESAVCGLEERGPGPQVPLLDERGVDVHVVITTARILLFIIWMIILLKVITMVMICRTHMQGVCMGKHFWFRPSKYIHNRLPHLCSKITLIMPA